jgi:hypothetical protein
MQEVLAEAGTSQKDALRRRLESLVHSKPIMLFMKGGPAGGGLSSPWNCVVPYTGVSGGFCCKVGPLQRFVG